MSEEFIRFSIEAETASKTKVMLFVRRNPDTGKVTLLVGNGHKMGEAIAGSNDLLAAIEDLEAEGQ